MDLHLLTDDELHDSSQKAASSAREETLKLLKHLNEVERRHLFSKFECSSLHGYCVKYLKMSDPQAGRRVSAARLLRELPVLEEKVIAGSMTLTSVCQMNSFIKNEAKAGNRLGHCEKLKLLNQVESQSTKKVERILLSQSSAPEVHFRESVRQKTESITEIKIIADEKLMTGLNRLKEIWSHALPGANYSDIIKRLVNEAVKTEDPNLKAQRARNRKVKRDSTAHARKHTTRSRQIPKSVAHEVWLRDQGCCTFVNERNGECCESKTYIEIDHIIPFGRGGESTVDNLRLRCRAHNHRHSVESYGATKANAWRRAPRTAQVR